MVWLSRLWPGSIATVSREVFILLFFLIILWMHCRGLCRYSVMFFFLRFVAWREVFPLSGAWGPVGWLLISWLPWWSGFLVRISEWGYDEQVEIIPFGAFLVCSYGAGRQGFIFLVLFIFISVSSIASGWGNFQFLFFCDRRC